MMENCPGLIKMSLMIKKHLLAFIILCGASFRSEERRVGKECRSPWVADH